MTNSLTNTEEIIEAKVAEVWLNLGILHEAVSAFSRQECLDSFWPCVGQNSRWIIPARRVAILLQTEPNRCQVVAWLERGKLIPPTGALFDPGQDMIGQTINGKGVKWFNHPWADTTAQDDLRHWLLKDDPDAILAVPIQANAETVGLMLFVLRSLRAADQTMLSSLATGYAMYVGATYAMLLTTTKLATANKKLEVEISERKRAEEALREHQEHLQELVAERTAELAKTNEQLQQEITEHKRTEGGLRESEARYRLLADHATDMISTHTAEGIYLYASPAAYTLLGYKPDEMVGHSAYEFFHPDDLKQIKESHTTVMRGTDASVEYRIRRKDGHYTWFETTSRSIYDKAGNTQEIVAVSRDVSERKRAEAALLKSEERYRLVSEMTSDYAYAFRVASDNQLILEWVTVAFTRITGFTYQELEAWGDWVTFIYPDDVPIAQQQAQNLFSGQSDVSEFRIVTKNKAVRWLRNYGRPLWDQEQGRVVAIYGAGQDITERKQAEEELRESEEKWRSLVENAPDFIFIIDRKHTIQFINRPIPGLSAKHVIGAKARDYVPPEYRDMVDERFERAFQTGEVDSYETASPSPDGRTLWYSTRIGPIKHEDQVVALTLISTDITERKQVEEALTYARDQALEASRLKSKLLAKVSHELRTPLNAILGFAELLEFGFYGALSDEQRGPLIEIIDSTNDLTNLVDELLDQAQLDAGQLKLNITQFAPLEIVGKVQNRMNILAQVKGIELMTEIAPDLPPILSGDRERVQQILSNLVSNAIKFTEAGHVKVRLYCPTESHWAMQILDTGPGIPSEARAKIFEPFQQVDDSITRKHGGSGLGLSIVKQITTLMGGQITLESEPGQGSTFTVLLPIQAN